MWHTLPQLLRYVIVLELVQALIWRYVDLRQVRQLSKRKFPVELRDVLTEREFHEATEYSLDKLKFSCFQDTANLIVNLALLASFYYPATYMLATSLSMKLGFGADNEYIVALLFLLVQEPLSYAIDIPFALYRDFVIEEKHGFNKKTVRLFLTDLVKSFLIAHTLGPLIVTLVIFVIKKGGKQFYYALWIVSMVLQFVLMWVYPTFIQPLFNKVEPLKNEELRKQIYSLAEEVKYPLTKIYEIDASKRSNHSNAYLYGFWKNKRIVLFDTLLEIPHPQILSVVGHELGHWYLNHTKKMLLMAAVQLFAIFYAFGFFIYDRRVYIGFGFDVTQIGYPVIVGLYLFGNLISPISAVLSILATLNTRRFEFQADAFACKLGFGPYLKKALIKLHKQNKSSPSVDWLYAWLHLSHPHLVERIRAIEMETKINQDSTEKRLKQLGEGERKEVVMSEEERKGEVKKDL